MPDPQLERLPTPPDDEGVGDESQSLTARLRVTQAEVAWPLAIAAGFVGAWIGLLTGFPGFVAIPATIGFAPLYLKLLEHDRLVVASAAATVWLVAIAAAVLGAALETSPERADQLVPLAAAYRAADLGFLDGRALVSDWSALGRNLSALVVLAVLARPWRGLTALFLLASLAATLMGGAVPAAAAAVAAGESASAVFLRWWPPYLALALVGATAVCTAVAARGPLLPLSGLEPGRRRVLWAGALLALGALALQPLLGPAWRQAVWR